MGTPTQIRRHAGQQSGHRRTGIYHRVHTHQLLPIRRDGGFRLTAVYPWARIRRPRLGRACLAAVMASLLAVACTDGNADGQAGAAAQITSQLAAEPTTPVAVPREMPDGYQFAGISTYHKSQDGTVAAASWRYDPIRAAPRLPVVELCVLVEHFDVADLCTPAEHRTEVVALQGLTMAIVPLGPGSDEAGLELWTKTHFTVAWRDVEWVRD